MARVFSPLLEDETLASDASRFKGFLKSTCGAFLDYMVEHPHLMRLFNWKQAEGWQMQVPPAALPQVVESIERTIAKISASLARFEGLHILVFQTEDANETARRFDQTGVGHSGVNGARLAILKFSILVPVVDAPHGASHVGVLRHLQ